MAVSSETSQVTLTGDGANDAFPTSFKFLEDDHLLVETSDDDGETWVTKTQGTHYTVAGEGVLSGGTVTFLVAPALDVLVRLTRVVPLTQPTDFVAYGSFSPTLHTLRIDQLAMVDQQQQRVADDLDLEVTELSEAVDALEVDFPALEAAVSAAIDTLQDTVNESIVPELAALDTRLDAAESDIDDLETGVATHETRLDALEAAPAVTKWSDEELVGTWVKIDNVIYDAPGYWKAGGVVHLEGFVTGGTPGAGGALLVTPLAVGYRPPYFRAFPIFSYSEDDGVTVVIGSVEIGTDGQITIITGASIPDYGISLDGVSWRVA